jgi:hypothetical protein
MESVEERIARLEAAIIDIDAHATPFGVDGDGFVTGGYVVSVGALHRALGKIGRTSPKCEPERPCPACGREAQLGDALKQHGVHEPRCVRKSWLDQEIVECKCGLAESEKAGLTKSGLGARCRGVLRKYGRRTRS